MKLAKMSTVCSTSVLLLLVSTVSNATVLNGDFSNGANGFESWNGELSSDPSFPPAVALTSDSDFGANATNYSASSPSATVTNDDVYWHASLFQGFDLSSSAGVWNLSFDYSFSVSDTAMDFIDISLWNSGSFVEDLLLHSGSSGSVNYDLPVAGYGTTGWELYFLVEDGDFITGDHAKCWL